MTCIKENAYKEPLVDVVSDNAVVTSSCLVKDIDILTVKEEELSFASNFKLRVGRNDYMHAFIGYFDIEFSCCHKPITFSTGPHAKYTHWKQAVFYFKETLTVDHGDVITGKIKCFPGKLNPRELDIQIAFQCENQYGNVKEVEDYHMC
jgi:protein arginine N-methyltransferase 1